MVLAIWGYPLLVKQISLVRRPHISNKLRGGSDNVALLAVQTNILPDLGLERFSYNLKDGEEISMSFRSYTPATF